MCFTSQINVIERVRWSISCRDTRKTSMQERWLWWIFVINFEKCVSAFNSSNVAFLVHHARKQAKRMKYEGVWWCKTWFHLSCHLRLFTFDSFLSSARLPDPFSARFFAPHQKLASHIAHAQDCSSCKMFIVQTYFHLGGGLKEKSYNFSTSSYDVFKNVPPTSHVKCSVCTEQRLFRTAGTFLLYKQTST